MGGTGSGWGGRVGDRVDCRIDGSTVGSDGALGRFEKQPREKNIEAADSWECRRQAGTQVGTQVDRRVGQQVGEQTWWAGNQVGKHTCNQAGKQTGSQVGKQTEASR